MKLYTVAILGATGAVGQEMMKILEERDFPVGKLIPLASARSAGKALTFKGEQITIQEAWSGIDVQLKRKANIIPNLVDTLKMQMKFEEDVLSKLTAARSGLVSSNKEEAMAADDQAWTTTE